MESRNPFKKEHHVVNRAGITDYQIPAFLTIMTFILFLLTLYLTFLIVQTYLQSCIPYAIFVQIFVFFVGYNSVFWAT